MKIGFTLDTLTSITGKERVVYELAKRLAKKHEVSVITFKNRIQKKIVRKFLKEKINLILLDYFKTLEGRFNYLTRYRKLISQLDLEVINTHGLILANAAALSKIPTIKTYHAHITVWNEFLYNPLRWIDYLLEESVSIYFAKKVISISKYAQSQLKKIYFKSSIVIPNGVDTKHFKPDEKLRKLFREKLHLTSNELLIGYVGRFTKQKNQQLLINLARNIKWKIILVGSGPLEDFYKKIAPNNVIFLKNLTEKELLEFYNAIDIYCHPSLWEGFGLPLLEASACGIPVIAFNKTALKEVVLHSRTGFLAEDSREFKKYLNVLIENEKLRKDLGKKARKFAIKFDWKHTVKKYERILRNTL
jgi:glycosyltransferase involved in cell wall biosynthesis